MVEIWKMKQRSIIVEQQRLDKELLSLKTIKTLLIEKNLRKYFTEIVRVFLINNFGSVLFLKH